MSRKEPFGYSYNETTKTKEPIPEQLEALKQAAEYIAQGNTMQAVRDWLVSETGRNISVPGLLKAIKYGKTPKEPS